jgi:hypothetical protein
MHISAFDVLQQYINIAFADIGDINQNNKTALQFAIDNNSTDKINLFRFLQNKFNDSAVLP